MTAALHPADQLRRDLLLAAAARRTRIAHRRRRRLTARGTRR